MGERDRFFGLGQARWLNIYLIWYKFRFKLEIEAHSFGVREVILSRGGSDHEMCGERGSDGGGNSDFVVVDDAGAVPHSLRQGKAVLDKLL